MQSGFYSWEYRFSINVFHICSLMHDAIFIRGVIWIHDSVEFTDKSPKVGTNSSFLMESQSIATFNTCVSNLKIKWGRKSLCSILAQMFFWETLRSLILFDEYTRGERSEEMYVHICGKENEKILSYIRSSMSAPKTQRSPPRFPVTLKQEIIKAIQPWQLIPKHFG
jgi:hypothetical protein